MIKRIDIYIKNYTQWSASSVTIKENLSFKVKMLESKISPKRNTKIPSWQYERTKVYILIMLMF